MLHLGRWLVRHLNDPALIIWLSQRGGTLHDRLQWQIEDRLDEFARLEREGKAAELNEISVNSPNAIPEPMMRTLWRLLLTGRVKSPWKELDLFRWRDRVKRDGLTATLRFELRELLAPKVTLRKPFRWGEEDKTSVQPKNLKKLVEWELVLSVDHVHSALRDFADKPWQAELLNDFQQLLCDALDLLRELGEAGDRNDRSFWDLPSISDHGQNRGFRDWVALIELLRDSWLAVWAADRERATRKAEAWYELPYPAFKRLAFFAARHDSCIATEQWVDWLLADEAWWLWSLESQREVLRLLVLQGRQLAPTDAKRLEEAILIGPPRAMYKAHLDADEWLRIVERGVWLRLAKLETSGLRLGGVAADRLTLLSAKNPKWSLASNERDEFSHWLSGTGDPDFEESREIEIAPRHRGELVRWLRQPLVKRSPFYEDTWRETCRTRFFTCLLALCDLAQEDIWPVDRWREALQVWSEDALVARSWRYAAPLVRTMSDELLLDLEHGVTWWLDVVSKNIERHDGVLLELCQRVLDLVAAPGSPWAADSDLDGSATTQAINHPVGHVTQALLNLWLTGEPNDNDQLPPEFESVFTRICMSQEHRFQHGRVMLASNSITLFRVDRSWTERNLLPLFQWAVDPVEAKAAWEGFLWSSRIYWPLLVALKSPFLETANRYGELGEMSRQYAALLTYVALEPYEGYAAQDFQAAIGNLPQEGLQEVAQALSQALEAAGERREEYWRNRVQPFWQKIWPKSRAIGSQSISESLARMCIAAGAEFPSALGAVYDWLQPVEHPYYVVHSLFEEGQCSRFPKEALKLLDAVVKEQPWLGDELGKCLDLIVAAALEVAQDPIYQRLREHARRFGR